MSHITDKFCYSMHSSSVLISGANFNWQDYNSSGPYHGNISKVKMTYCGTIYVIYSCREVQSVLLYTLYYGSQLVWSRARDFINLRVFIGL